MIYNEMATWEDVAEALKLSVSYCRKIVKEHYKSENAYNKLQELKRTGDFEIEANNNVVM